MGGCQISLEKNRYSSTLLAVRGGGWMSNQISRKKITLDWPRTLNMHDLMAPAIVHMASINRAT